ncbi:restriction endonuclease subunit S [Lactobacillus delbrueckii subsp. bulgaricus]
MGDLADRVTTKNKGMVSELPLTISAQDGLISQDEFFNKKVASKDLSSYLLLHHGDFAYNKSYSNGYPFGTIKRLEKYPQGVVSSLYIAFKPNSSISSDFMAQYYESNNWHKEIYKCAAEGARNHGLLNVPPSDFFATNLNIPITKSEQLKIGRLLNAVDQTITLHEEKKRQLERLKSALLQKMFADKSGYPDIRFEGFSDEWEQCKLGDVCEPITDSIDTQKYPNEVFAEYSMPAFDASMKPDIVLGSSMNSVRKIITRPCLLVNKLNVRKKRIWYVKKPNKNAVCSAEFIPLRSDTVDLTFLNQVAKSETFTRYLENHSSGSSNSQKRITPRSLMLSKLHIPTIEEQKLIGKIFEYLDHTITLHDQKLNLLKLVKQSLLQNMFI